MTRTTRAYFDYNASAPLLECARVAMLECLENVGNASSVHFEGRGARKRVEAARSQVANLIGAKSANVIFTAGATEAAHHALSPVIRGGGHELNVSKVYISASEHPCMLAGGRFAAEQIELLPVWENGCLDTEQLRARVEAHDHNDGMPMVVVQFANSETGVIQPLHEISQLVHAHDGVLVVDAVQAAGKIAFTLEETGADFLLLSGHKIGAPQGVGALVLANGSLSPKPLFSGGGQENYHRSGTENCAAIAGFGAACAWHQENLSNNLQNYQLRDSIEADLSTISIEGGNGVPHPVFFGKNADRLPNTCLFSVPGVKAETALMALDLAGISVSSGSACSSGKVKQSHVLEAMGAKPEEMAGAIRLSLGWASTEDEASHFLAAWKTIIGRLAA